MKLLKLVLSKAYFAVFGPLYRRLFTELQRQLTDEQARAMNTKFADHSAQDLQWLNSKIDELSANFETVVQEYANMQERTHTRMIDEMLRLSARVEEGVDDNAKQKNETEHQAWDGQLSDQLIAQIVGDISTNLGVIETCHKYQIPLTVVLRLKSDYQGMDKQAIKRVRMLEKRYNALLNQEPVLIAASAEIGASNIANTLE